jgi:hypothetical protein
MGHFAPFPHSLIARKTPPPQLRLLRDFLFRLIGQMHFIAAVIDKAFVEN